jgi:hypothetical protein
MSFNSTLAGGGGGAVTFRSPLQEASTATAIKVITRLRTRATRTDIELIMIVLADYYEAVVCFWHVLYPRAFSPL